MNVKKESLRGKILEYLSNNPRAEVKDIASYVNISKQALYYHIKLLSKQQKIKIVDSHFINGIEKKFYSLSITQDTIKRTEEVTPSKKIPISTIINGKKSSLPHTEDSTIKDKQLSLDNSTADTNVESDTTIEPQKPLESTSLDKTRIKGSIQTKDTAKPSSSTKNTHSDIPMDEKISLFDRFFTIINNIKNLGLFNLDTYDTYNSATLFITSSNKKITFNNRQRSEFNVLIVNENDPVPEQIKRNGRLLVVEENFVDNHERIIVPIKKEKEQEAFLKRYILKKYNIPEDELLYTYEKFKAKEKDMYELNTLFTRSKYLGSSLEASKEFKTKNRLFISLAGIFTYYNFQLGRATRNEINLYLYMGVKGCELTWIKGKRILYNRTILISNQAISEASYLSEAIPSIVRTIKVSLESLKKDGLVEKQPDNIYVSGPNSSESIKDYFQENYKVEVENINVKINRGSNKSQFKDLKNYYDTTMILERSLNRWGRFRYVYDQKNKLNLRKTGIYNVINLVMSLTAAILILLNIQLFEQKVVQDYDEMTARLSAEMRLELISNTEGVINNRYKLNKIDNTLGNIKAAKHNSIELIKLLNSPIFKKVDISSMEINATDPNVYDSKNLEVKISGGVINRRPEAILEVTNIQQSLKKIEYVDNSVVEYKSYQGNTLPITIRFTI
ncbi:MAG: winged helix-turn-helix domain-containing protein [Candidatus Neomarinimicrobiota bacterium]|nr:winged helix-turn-helix domain-containing protein [Candidatus Neomarinimicrobiota bacterium]